MQAKPDNFIREKLIRQTREYLKLAHKAGLNERELAARLGVSMMSIWRWRTGRNVPTAALFLKLKGVASAIRTAAKK